MGFVASPTIAVRNGGQIQRNSSDGRSSSTRVRPADRRVNSANLRMTATEGNAPTIHFGEIQHAGMLVKDVVASKEFYMSVFGMSDDTHKRGKLPFPGAFLRAGASQIHLMELPNPDPLENRAEHGGRYVAGLRL